VSGDLRATKFSFQDIFHSLTCALRFEEMLDCILAVALRELDADEGSLLLRIGEEDPTLKMLASRGLPEEILTRGYVPWKGSLSERVMREMAAVIVNGEHPQRDELPTPLRPRRILSALCAPLVVQGKAIGTLNLNRTRPDRQPFDERHLATARMLAAQAAMVISNHQLQEQIAQQERLATIGQVMTSIAHCMKNVLTAVHGGLGILRIALEQDDIAQARQHFELLRRNVMLMSNLVLDLLDCAKERQPLRQMFLVSELASYLGDILSHRAREQGIELILEAPSDLEFWGDKDQLSRAMLNLALNAIEACATKPYPSGEQPRVSFRATRQPAKQLPLAPPDAAKASEWLVLEITDNGPGIPEEQQKVMWELFFSTKGTKGTGIGLPAARKVVREHGGKILVRSEVGVGTTFTILLPFYREE